MKQLRFFFVFGLLSFFFVPAQNSEVLVAFGFENVVERKVDNNYELFYEDNLYRFPADGLSKVLQIIDEEALLTNNTIILLDKGLPLVEMHFSSDAFRQLKSAKITPEAFIKSTDIRFTDKEYDPTISQNSSYFKTDINLRLTLDYTLGNFDNPIRQRVNFQPFLDTDLSKGVNINAYYNVPAFDDLSALEPQLGLLKISNDFKLDSHTFLNMNFGFYNFNRLGVTMNYLKFLYKDVLRFHLHSGFTRYARLNKDFILFYSPDVDFFFNSHADLIYRWNKYDMDVTFRYGSYISRDIGYTLQVQRFKGQRFIGLFYKKTNFGNMVGFDFRVPLIRKYNRKLPVRVKLFDHFYLPYNYVSNNNVARLFYQGENITTRYTDFFPEIIRKGLLKRLKNGL